MADEVVLVDDNDHEIGREEKLRAHQNGGKLHRAVSVFVFNKNGELMLQRRAAAKYHAQGLWANTCCSHPAPGERPIDAAHRRLGQEMGFDCVLREAFRFRYAASVGNGLTEREYDHVFFGSYDGEPRINGDEVSDWRWIGLEQLQKDIAAVPNSFAPWLVLMMGSVVKNRGKG